MRDLARPGTIEEESDDEDDDDKCEEESDDEDDDDIQPFTTPATTLNEPVNDSGTYPVCTAEYTKS